MSNKVFFSILFLFFTIIAAIAGLYGGGYYFLKESQIDTTLVSYDTLFNYYNAYQDNKAIKQLIGKSFLIALGITLLPSLFGFFVFVSVQKKVELHGSARFANDLEIKKRGLID